jgi:hypothetical protein
MVSTLCFCFRFLQNCKKYRLVSNVVSLEYPNLGETSIPVEETSRCEMYLVLVVQHNKIHACKL